MRTAMRHNEGRVRIITILLAVILLGSIFSGCSTPDVSGGELTEAQATDTDTGISGNSQSETYCEGLQTESLDAVSCDSGRANETSGGNVWETETGYYFLWAPILFYADKSDLSKWVPVCSRPDCKHTSSGGSCDAIVMMESVLKDDRIYYNTSVRQTAALAGSGLRGEFIASMALDGTDKRVEYYIPETQALIGDSYGSRSVLTEDYFVYNLSTLNAEGVFETYVYLVDQQGARLLVKGTQEGNVLGVLTLRQDGIFGDQGFYSNLIEGSSYIAYRVADGNVYAADLAGLNQPGSNLMGDSLWLYRANDGYYDVDVTTREEGKLANAQVENGTAYILLRNCILESALLGYDSLTRREGVESHVLYFFNGEVWQEVTLPEELVHAPDTVYLTPQAVTSDRILLLYQDTEKRYYEPIQLYQILLTTDTPTLEYLATLG